MNQIVDFFFFFNQGVAPESRREIYRAIAKALASLHSADVDAIGLGKYGRRENYCKRQVHEFVLLILAYVMLVNACI